MRFQSRCRLAGPDYHKAERMFLPDCLSNAENVIPSIAIFSRHRNQISESPLSTFRSSTSLFLFDGALFAVNQSKNVRMRSCSTPSAALSQQRPTPG